MLVLRDNDHDFQVAKKAFHKKKKRLENKELKVELKVELKIELKSNSKNFE